MDLHNYQKRAANFIEERKTCVLSVDMGLGKTAAVLAWLDWAVHTHKVRTCLIVAPKRVAENQWKQEAEKWDLDELASLMVICYGRKGVRIGKLQDGSKPIKIISRDNVKDVLEVTTDFDALIIDELTSFKNVEGERTKAILKINADYKIGLTGTFLANGAIDIYGQCAAVGLASKWSARNFYAWRGEWFVDVMAGSGQAFHKWKLYSRSQSDEPLTRMLEPLKNDIFTLTAEDYLTIPPVTETVHAVDVGDNIRRNIEELDSFLGTEIGGEVVAFSDKSKFAKLQTLCNGFVYVDNEEGQVAVRSEVSRKLEEVANFVAECKEAGEPVLLFYAYREEAIWLGELLKARGVRFESVKASGFLERWNNHETECLFAHPASAGHGLNLQHGGRVIVWSTLTYNYEFFAQGNARLARQGQKHNVQIHYFIAQDTCEGRVVKALSRKQSEQAQFLNLTKQ